MFLFVVEFFFSHFGSPFLQIWNMSPQSKRDDHEKIYQTKQHITSWYLAWKGGCWLDSECLCLDIGSAANQHLGWDWLSVWPWWYLTSTITLTYFLSLRSKDTWITVMHMQMWILCERFAVVRVQLYGQMDPCYKHATPPPPSQGFTLTCALGLDIGKSSSSVHEKMSVTTLVIGKPLIIGHSMFEQ